MWDNKKIKNIIFDLGGVLFDINYRSTVEAYAKIGFLNFDEAYSQANQNKWFDDFEIGQISNADLRNYLRTKLPSGISDQEMDKAWNAMLIGMPDFKFNTLSALKPHFKLFLLSNTNGIGYLY
jgi:putative hydrolase of the HAD superfamily